MDGERTDYLSLVISSSLSSFGAQKRFPASTTIGELKVRSFQLERTNKNNPTFGSIPASHVGEIRADYRGDGVADAAATLQRGRGQAGV